RLCANALGHGSARPGLGAGGDGAGRRYFDCPHLQDSRSPFSRRASHAGAGSGCALAAGRRVAAGGPAQDAARASPAPALARSAGSDSASGGCSDTCGDRGEGRSARCSSRARVSAAFPCHRRHSRAIVENRTGVDARPGRGVPVAANPRACARPGRRNRLNPSHCDPVPPLAAACGGSDHHLVRSSTRQEKGGIMNSIIRSVSKFRSAVIAIVLSAAVVASAAFIRIHDDKTISSNLPAFSENTIAPLLALDRATEAIAARITPAVVYIRVSGKTAPSRASGQGQMDPSQIPEPFRQFFQFGPGEMQPQPQYFSAQGSGVIVSPDGYIVTNNHVVHGATTVDVILNDKREFDGAKVVGTDANTDLAVVKINATGLPSASFGDSSLLKPGQSVLAIGDPLGMDFSVTRGIVSATGRSRTQSDGSNSYGSFIQTDAPINHGNSGGPLVDAQGDVVGINTEMLSTSGASAGIGFAIPSDIVQPIAESLIKNGKVVRGYLGIDVTDLPPGVADSLNES